MRGLLTPAPIIGASAASPTLASMLEDSRYVCMYVCMVRMWFRIIISVIYLSGALPQVWARDHARPHNALHSPSNSSHDNTWEVSVHGSPTMYVENQSKTVSVLFQLSGPHYCFDSSIPSTWSRKVSTWSREEFQLDRRKNSNLFKEGVLPWSRNNQLQLAHRKN